MYEIKLFSDLASFTFIGCLFRAGTILFGNKFSSEFTICNRLFIYTILVIYQGDTVVFYINLTQNCMLILFGLPFQKCFFFDMYYHGPDQGYGMEQIAKSEMPKKSVK